MHQKEWLFPQNFEVEGEGGPTFGPMTSEEYLTEFSRNGRFFLMRCPSPYLFPILEKYKEKVAFSSHLISGPAIVPYTVLQLNGVDAHAIVDWIWDAAEARFIFPITLFIKNQHDYVRFLEENRNFECELKEQRLGFGESEPS